MQPKLRFKDYSTDWQSMTLNSVSEQIGDGLHSTPVYDSDGEFFFINGNNLVDGQIKITESTKRLNHIEIQKHKIRLSSNCILMSINGTIGNLAFYQNQKILLGKSACYINLKEDINKQFIYQLLQSPSLKKSFTGELTGSTIKNLSLGTIRDTIFFSPDKSEAAKIASLLSTVDEKIKQLTRSHELLTQYKQGVMQKIFNQELSFKADDGSDYPDWEEKKLEQIASISMGQSPDSSSYNSDSNGTPLVQGNADIINRITAPRTWTSAPTKFCNKNDIILTVRAPVGAVAKSNTQACIGRGVCAITPMAKTSKEYLYQLLVWYESFKWLSIEQGSTFTAVSGNDIKGIGCPTPSTSEQAKIANFLSAIDKKINNTQAQLEATKQYKQGLLQQMFV